MTTSTLKPSLLRADTIDLQSQQNPSAKDHTRGQNGGYSHASQSSTAPHHAQALRNADQDAYQERHTSPRLGGFGHDNIGPQAQTHMYDDGDEDDDEDDDEDEDEDKDNHVHNGSNGHAHHADGYDDVDGDGNDSQDEDMDDELLDKISSSPSIEDGKQAWPTRADSLYHGQNPGPWSAPTRGISFSPQQDNFGPREQSPSKEAGGSHQSERSEAGGSSHFGSIDFNDLPRLSPTPSPNRGQDTHSGIVPESSSIENINRYCLPKDDPFLQYDGDDCPNDVRFDEHDPDWEDEGFCEDSSSDDDQDDFPFHLDSRFIDSGWGGECLREIEDIDFEFVYALHTFVATVEGQANAAKGDTMVLLDDSNSYWWLVRVVKDGSIGYLPAEHIETPTERLARLNKHRNLDLSAAMLGDNPEKSRNPLQRAIRRRNAKTVNFAPPTYYEPDDQEWSDDEEEGHGGEVEPAAHVENNAEEERHQRSQHSQQIQQVNQPTDQQRAQPATATIHRVGEDEDMGEDDEEPSSPVKVEASAPEPLQTTSQDAGQRSRRVLVRNTDSFFKDDTLETRKISLTPRLLRGDGDSTGSTEQEVKQRVSLDTFDKVTADDKSKDGKKKEKKGMLSGLFKRKDKSGKASKGDSEDADRASEDSRRSPQSKDSMEVDITPERKSSKLQKAPPSVISPNQSPTETKAPQRDFASMAAQQQGPSAPLGPVPAVARSQTDTSQPAEQSQNLAAAQPTPGRFPSLNEKRSVFAPITGALRSKTPSQDVDDSAIKPIYSKRAKERFAIDDSGSEDDSTPTAHSSILHRSVSPLDANDRTAGRPGSEQPVSPLHVQEHRKPPPESIRASIPAETRAEAVQTVAAEVPPTSPSEQTASTSKHSPSVATHTPSTSRSTPTWSDASLRSYMDNDQDVRDLIVIVHDKTNVQPVGPDHPLMNGLFSSERTKLADMQTQLDSMLMLWLAKKNQPVAAKV